MCKTVGTINKTIKIKLRINKEKYQTIIGVVIMDIYLMISLKMVEEKRRRISLMETFGIAIEIIMISNTIIFH